MKILLQTMIKIFLYINEMLSYPKRFNNFYVFVEFQSATVRNVGK